MKIELSNITVKQLVEQYEDNQEDGVVGFGGRLNIRPPFQREFVYNQRLVLPGVELYCGDSLDIAPTLQGVDALISDPPYGMGYFHGGNVKGGTETLQGGNPKTARAKAYAGAGAMIIGDDKPFDPTPWLQYPSVILWGGNHFSDKLPKNPKWLIWDKIVVPETYGKFSFARSQIVKWHGPTRKERLESTSSFGKDAADLVRATQKESSIQIKNQSCSCSGAWNRQGCRKARRCLIHTWEADQQSSPQSEPGGRLSASRKTRNTSKPPWNESSANWRRAICFWPTQR